MDNPQRLKILDSVTLALNDDPAGPLWSKLRQLLSDQTRQSGTLENYLQDQLKMLEQDVKEALDAIDSE